MKGDDKAHDIVDNAKDHAEETAEKVIDGTYTEDVTIPEGSTSEDAEKIVNDQVEEVTKKCVKDTLTYLIT